MFTVNSDIPNAPEVITSPNMTLFGNENFTVTLKWPQFNDETYSVATVPEVVHKSYTGSTSVQLIMLYNTQYNVTVIATLCGHKNATNSTTLHYYHYSKKMAALCLLGLIKKIFSHDSNFESLT